MMAAAGTGHLTFAAACDRSGQEAAARDGQGGGLGQVERALGCVSSLPPSSGGTDPKASVALFRSSDLSTLETDGAAP